MEVVADEEVTNFDASLGDQAREWLATVYAAMERMPAGKLFALLKPSITVMHITASALVVCCTGGVYTSAADREHSFVCRFSLSTKQKHLLNRYSS